MLYVGREFPSGKQEFRGIVRRGELAPLYDQGSDCTLAVYCHQYDTGGEIRLFETGVIEAIAIGQKYPLDFVEQTSDLVEKIKQGSVLRIKLEAYGEQCGSLVLEHIPAMLN